MCKNLNKFHCKCKTKQIWLSIFTHEKLKCYIFMYVQIVNKKLKVLVFKKKSLYNGIENKNN